MRFCIQIFTKNILKWELALAGSHLPSASARQGGSNKPKSAIYFFVYNATPISPRPPVAHHTRAAKTAITPKLAPLWGQRVLGGGEGALQGWGSRPE